MHVRDVTVQVLSLTPIRHAAAFLLHLLLHLVQLLADLKHRHTKQDEVTAGLRRLQLTAQCIIYRNLSEKGQDAASRGFK